MGIWTEHICCQSLNPPVHQKITAQSTYHYALSHPARPTRPKLWKRVTEIFSRCPNGCGHREIAMCLRSEDGARIADKTVLKIMHEMGISCGIRRETDYHRYNWDATSRPKGHGRRWGQT